MERRKTTVELYIHLVLTAVFHGFGGRMTVSDVGPTTVNKIMEQCFKEIGLKKRDLNGQTPFGKKLTTSQPSSVSSVFTRGVATGWILVFIPPKSAQVNFFMG